MDIQLDNTTNVLLKSSSDGDLQKDFMDLVDSWPLMSSRIPISLLLTLYWIFVLYLGPKLMKRIRPFQLTGILLIYNIFQVLTSTYMVVLTLPHLWRNGITHEECTVKVDSLKSQVLNGAWIYFFIKVTELLDTIFFVLRKKDNQITFLHVYHHSILVITTWLYLKYSLITEHIIFLACINSFVHIIMYSYYALAALGPSVAPYLFWKKYITTLQLVQFVLILIHMLASFYVSNCPPSKLHIYYFSANLILFIYLFSDFYRRTYTAKPKDVTVNGKKAL